MTEPNERTNGKVHTSKTSRANRNRAKKKHKKPRVRLFPLWLRLIIVVILLLLSLAAGAIIGYGVIGEGEPFDVLKKRTWQQIVEIVVKE